MLVLYYDGNDANKRSLVKKKCDDLSIPFREILPEDQSLTIGELLEGSRGKDATQECVNVDLLICHELNDELISTLLQSIRKEGAAMERTCVVTKYNITWKFLDLLHEIIEEHECMKLKSACQKEMKQISLLKEELYTPQSWALYQDAILKGFILLQQGRLQKDQLQAILHEIEEKKADLIRKN